MNYYFYKMTVDNGGAPCCTYGSVPLWTLAICKPRIRASADKGDVVVGFAGAGIDPDNGVIHMARVTAKAPGIEYYAPDSIYRARADCIYSQEGEDYRVRENPFHGETDRDREIGR